MAGFRPVTHVIFDLDGLLLDTEGIYYRVQSAIVERYGKIYYPELRQRILGTIEPETARIFIEELNLPLTREEFIQLQNNGIKELMPYAALMPGAERLIRHFYEKGIPIAVATSSSSASVELKTTQYRPLFSLMSHVVCGSSDPEIKRGKPEPDIFLVCASRFPDRPSPANVLVFEDAPNGVLAARAAGMQVVMVPEEAVPLEKRQAATLVIPSLQEFQPQLFGLPPFGT